MDRLSPTIINRVFDALLHLLPARAPPIIIKQHAEFVNKQLSKFPPEIRMKIGGINLADLSPYNRRILAGTLLAEISFEKAYPHLLSIVQNRLDNIPVRLGLLDLLVKHEAPTLFIDLFPIALNPRQLATVREKCLWTLIYLHDPRLLSMLHDLVQNGREPGSIRKIAAEGIGIYRMNESIPVLFAALSNLQIVDEALAHAIAGILRKFPPDLIIPAALRVYSTAPELGATRHFIKYLLRPRPLIPWFERVDPQLHAPLTEIVVDQGERNIPLLEQFIERTADPSLKDLLTQIRDRLLPALHTPSGFHLLL
jgi:hypothetical protein